MSDISGNDVTWDQDPEILSKADDSVIEQPVYSLSDEPVTETADIDWLRRITRTTISRTKNAGPDTDVEHIAYFGVKPGSLPDLLAQYSSTVHFQPHFLSAKWRDGVLVEVDTSGPQRLKSTDLSDKLNKHQRWSSYRGVDRSEIPDAIQTALTAYETKVAVAVDGFARS